MENEEKINELIKLKVSTGLSWNKFADYFGIPLRTMQDWYMGKRRIPEYLLRLMIYKIEMERTITSGQEEGGQS